VMIKRATVIATRQFDSLSLSAWHQTAKDLWNQGWHPYLVTATGPANDPVVAGVFREMKAATNTRHNMTAAELAAENQQMMDHGSILVSVDAYGTPADTRYIATWHPNTDNAAWNCDAIDADFAKTSHYFKALTSVWARPQLLAVTPAHRFVVMFVDTHI